MPSAVTVEFLRPLHWERRYGPEAADDERIVDACYDEVSAALQSAIDRMHRENPHPVLTGVSRLANTVLHRATG
jgi:hypothetical protein